jgi:hypothetical protein
MGTFGELDGNTLGTTKMKIFPSPLTPTPKIKEKKKHPSKLFIGCMKFLFPK